MARGAAGLTTILSARAARPPPSSLQGMKLLEEAAVWGRCRRRRPGAEFEELLSECAGADKRKQLEDELLSLSQRIVLSTRAERIVAAVHACYQAAPASLEWRTRPCKILASTSASTCSTILCTHR